MTQFDYTNQCWIVDGIIQECGHKWSEDCGCYGRKHAGTKHSDLCKSSHCDVCHAINIGLTDKFDTCPKFVWTKAQVKLWLVKCEPKSECAKTRALITRALLFMYARQTADEQATQATRQSNGIGFTGVDAEFLSSVAQRCTKYNQDISPKQFVYVRKKLVKYSGQLVEFANSL